jgi:hypothetical protein
MPLSLVQSKSGSATSSPVTVTLTSPTGAGNCLIVYAGANNTSAAPAVSTVHLGGVADNFAAAETETGTNCRCEIWTDQDAASGQTVIAVAFTGGSGLSPNYQVIVEEWSGVLSASAVDAVNHAAGSSASSFSSGATGTLAQATEVVTGAVMAYVGSGTETITGPASPWTNETKVAAIANVGLVSGYQVVSATTTQTYSGTLTASSIYAACIVSLKGLTTIAVPLTVAQVTIAALPPAPSVPVSPLLTVAQVTIAAYPVTPATPVLVALAAAQAVIAAHPVSLSRQLLISLASEAGTDDYGNSFPQGIFAAAGVIKGPQFAGSDFIINQAGTFFYSGTPAAGNLIASVASSASTDTFGNHYLQGVSSYQSGFANAMIGGALLFYTGSLSGGWVFQAQLVTDNSGDLLLSANGSIYANGNLIS